jgi:hypothetical protein
MNEHMISYKSLLAAYLAVYLFYPVSTCESISKCGARITGKSMCSRSANAGKELPRIACKVPHNSAVNMSWSKVAETVPVQILGNITPS